jgi:hypothetical protein
VDAAFAEHRADTRRVVVLEPAGYRRTRTVMTNIITMFWDRFTPTGDNLAGIEVVANRAIEIPANACGFRLGLPNEPWNQPWQFSVPHVPGQVFEHGSIEYSSAFTGLPSPGAISARGPVHGCSRGAYEFQTPLGAYGISGDDPVWAGAGSFIANFVDANDITWLDAAGAEVHVEEEEELEPPELPPEFFEQPPKVEGCFRDFEDKLICPESARAAGPSRGGVTLMAGEGGAILGIEVIRAPIGRATRVARGRKINLVCPAKLLLRATFYRDYTFEPATVEYRFRFAQGAVSTVFTKLLDHAGPNVVTHSVPIPLPPPIGRGPSGGGAAGGPVVFTAQRVRPSGGGQRSHIDDFAIEDLPDNEHKGAVRVEVLNAAEGLVSSDWESYHIVCQPGGVRPGRRVR